MNTNLVKDKESGSLRLPHRLDESTGMYRGKQIVPKKEVKAKKKDHDKRLEAHKDEDVAGDRQPMAAVKDEKKKTGILGKVGQKGKANSRSGMGGGA